MEKNRIPLALIRQAQRESDSTDKPEQLADTKLASGSPAPRVQRMPFGCEYQGRHLEAAEPCTDIGADTGEATMGEGAGVILWPLSMLALAFIVWLAATFWP